MKKLSVILVGVVSLLLVGCADNGPAHGENVTEKIKQMDPADRFKLIKENTGMGIPMKEKAIDGLPVDEAQKEAWKKEVREAGGSSQEGPIRTNQ